MSLIIIFGLLESIIVSAVVFCILLKKRLMVQGFNAKLKENLSSIDLVKQKADSLMSQLVPFEELKGKVKELLKANETLKLEKGRVSLTQAEQDTVDRRLRELEEIERELDASNIEVKKELDILDGKQREIKIKNESLNLKIQENLQEIERMVSEVKMEDNVKDEILEIKNRLVETQIETQKLTEAHNLEKNQYVILKRRFDALDIEYAQLYEKFTSK